MAIDNTTAAITIGRRGEGHRLRSSVTLPRPLDEVFAFFADAGNLERLTPPSLRFEILTPGPIEMFEGALLDYRLRIHRIPIRWRTEIAAWEPPFMFIDEQLRGPYRWWRHQHRFMEVEGRTSMIDIVDYGVPFVRLVHRLFVAPDLLRIFEYRRRVVQELFGVCEDTPAVGTRARKIPNRRTVSACYNGRSATRA